MSGIIINMPYTAQSVPEAVRQRLALSGEAWQMEHWRLIDPYLAELGQAAATFKRPENAAARAVLIYPYSPLVADPWGLWAAELAEPEEERRPGFLPKTTEGQPIAWAEAERELIFGRTVKPFHDDLSAAVKEVLAQKPLALIVTLRSFNDRPWKFEKNKKYPRPQVAVGAAQDLTPDGLADLAGGTFRSLGWWPELNWPQGGAFAPDEFKGHPRVRAIGISLGRELYMDPRTRRKKASIKAAVRVLGTVLNLMDQELDRIAEVRLERARSKKKTSSIIKAKDLKP